MTAKQQALYWRLWANVKKTYIGLGGYSAADADAQRAILTEEALGEPKSSADLTNADLDKVLDAFRTVLTLWEGPPEGAPRAVDMPRRRLIYAIDKIGLDGPYLDAISKAKFGVPHWRDLPERELGLLRMTACARARSKAKKETATAMALAQFENEIDD